MSSSHVEGCGVARCENSALQEEQIDSEDREGTALCCALLEKMEGVRGADERLTAAKRLQVMSLEAVWQLRLRHSGAIHRLVHVLLGKDEGNFLRRCLLWIQPTLRRGVTEVAKLCESHTSVKGFAVY